ncbi:MULTISPECIES: flagellar assembly peptidoglycan hydrolase FlgJ [Brenneria]|uniref:Peptidoglycan hydrolase FlgJ n=1 Tax=Brenneria nigrifluens DSM 30175 = ATCC 13028 TaxID=1121120 RepID=A0A2U1UUM9_9GAMM|nr:MULTISPECIES: flagellar assembly peptidoglycan hydrolase FlgJ [Brenneria]EHD22032.1 flagellar rod assembly protein/muramidase FlgJ [Brenneria sp. EniD312]PWC25363.1 flagellar assembly peptidoglycan hydrolase FlgJ [Brenneria nigrifluens DSM 30175 = ATCC 13028]QCR05115.1 flagellar assembly peptidoglycan hydrolase FlgJ [Brenneria nigrifluens DSM 30175 = ATCC 13028]
MKDIQTLSSAAYDAQSLNSLKREVSGNPQSKEGIRAVAQQMEGLFVQMMMKSMRSALPQDGIFSSEQTRLYTSMYDQQLSQQVAGKGLGLADVMVRQLSGERAASSEPKAPVPLTFDGPTLQSMPAAAVEQIVRRAMPKLPAEGSALPLTSENFVSHLSLPAQMASQQSGIPHHLIIAQAALESGWGQREIPTEDGRPSHNLFGIKAGSRWDGPVTEITTTEYEQGVAKKVKASFRVYESYAEAIGDYVKLLTQNPRYADVANAGSAEQAAHALQSAGYATDPQYAKKLVGMIQQMKSSGEKAVKAYTHDLSRLF